MAKKEVKTNAMRILDRMKIPYTHQAYECDEFVDGIQTADNLGLPHEKVYKTLVTQGNDKQYYVFVLPDVYKRQVGTITINREKALNALNSQVLDELNATLDAVDLNTVRCLILTGAGQKSFVAGADIGEMSTLTCLLYTSYGCSALPP